MNILQMEDMVKGLPDQILMQEAQMPSGQIPQFLALSEVQRRQEMRQKLQAPPEATVADQILQGGIASAMPQQGPQQPPAPPQGMPQGMPPQGQPPAMMYGGGMVPSGIVRMQNLGQVPNESPALRRARIYNEIRNARMAGADPQVIKELEDQLRILTPAGTLSAGAAAQQGAMNQPMFEAMNIAPTMETPTVSMDQPEFDLSLPPAAQTASVPAAAPAGVAPDATAMGTPAPTGTTDQISGLPEFQRETPPAFLQELLSRLGGGTSPEVQEAIDLRRSLMEQGLPAPIDLGQFIQAAEQRQLEAKEEAKRMALANVLTSLGAGLLEGDAAAGLQQATKLAGETLREGRKEARAEGRMAEQLRLQAAQQERQNIIDAMKFKSESVDAIASLISGEKKADLTNSLQAAQLLVQFENNQNNLEMELRKQGFSDEKIKRELERVALQSATRIVEGLISSGQLEVQNTTEAGSIIKRLANQFTGTYGEEDLSSDNVMNYSDLAKQNQ